MKIITYNDLQNKPSKGYNYMEAFILDFKGPRPIGSAEKKGKSTYNCLIHLACLNTRKVFNIVLKSTKETGHFFSVDGMTYRGRVISLINPLKSLNTFYGLSIVTSGYQPILMPGMSTFSNEIHLSSQSTGGVANSSKEAKYEVFVIKANPEDLCFTNCKLIETRGNPHCESICAGQLQRCCGIDARGSSKKVFCVSMEHKDLTAIAGSDDCSIVYCASSFMHKMIQTSVLKNENVPLMDKQDFFMASLDEWKDSIKDKQDSIRIVVFSRSQYIRDEGGGDCPTPLQGCCSYKLE